MARVLCLFFFSISIATETRNKCCNFKKSSTLLLYKYTQSASFSLVVGGQKPPWQEPFVHPLPRGALPPAGRAGLAAAAPWGMAGGWAEGQRLLGVPRAWGRLSGSPSLALTTGSLPQQALPLGLGGTASLLCAVFMGKMSQRCSNLCQTLSAFSWHIAVFCKTP